jgi:polyphenol oxidase
MPDTQTSTTKPLFRIPEIFANVPGLVSAESTRHGGVSAPPFYSLNLGGSTQDKPENVMENNLRFFGALEVPFEQVAKSHQVHGTEILHTEVPGRFEGFDALITNTRGVQLAITVADCTPVLVYDPVQKAVGAAHAGWKGTVGEIAVKMIAKMSEQFGTVAADCLGYVGTCIDECSFEVDSDVSQHFDDPYKQWDAVKGKFLINLKAANKNQLLKAGLLPEHIEVSQYSTVLHNEEYFSHRKEKGTTGRMLVTIGLRD